MKKLFYRKLESLIKKIYNVNNNSKNKELKRTFRSAMYNTSDDKKFLFSNHGQINYILKNREEITKRVFIDGNFDFRLLKKGLKYLKKKRKVLINIGAHVGTTLVPAIKEKIFQHCIAFEPSIDNFRLLTANININQIENQVSLFNLAISNKIAKGYLRLFDPNNSGDFRVTNGEGRGGKKIQLNILDNFTSKINKDNALILIDAQGHEPEIFLGGRRTLQKKIPIIFELMPSIMNKDNPEKLYKSIKHYKNLTDLRKNKVIKMNKIDFLKIYEFYKTNKSYTDIMVF